MTSWGKTSIVYNNPNKLIGLPPYYYRLRSCDTNLTSNTPANQYQIQKQIQNTVRVYSSLYTSNLGPLSAYKRPITDKNAGLYGVCWNQMSDRPVPSVQKATIPTGFANSLNNRHNSVTSSRPGCQTPGGVGCDIKHNSYDRYLNRLKAKGPLRRGYVPPGFGAPILFNPAFPIYGGKTVKTNIINGCDCPIQDKKSNLLQDIHLYSDPLIQAEPSGTYAFQVGDYVYAIETGTNYYSKAIVIQVLSNNQYLIEFVKDEQQETQNISQLLVYFPCNCTTTLLSNDFIPYTQTALDYLKSKTNICDNNIIDYTAQY
jgi:hypothetical protein